MSQTEPGARGTAQGAPAAGPADSGDGGDQRTDMDLRERPADREARVEPERHHRRSLYARLLRLRHVHLAPWQRGLLAEGSVVLAVLLALAELASAWVLVVLPLTVTAVVKAHDLLAGELARGRTTAAPDP